MAGGFEGVALFLIKSIHIVKFIKEFLAGKAPLKAFWGIYG